MTPEPITVRNIYSFPKDDRYLEPDRKSKGEYRNCFLGTVSITWVPPSPGEYNVHVLYAGKDIQHSPFTARVAGK